jgi:hypothetical protein
MLLDLGKSLSNLTKIARLIKLIDLPPPRWDTGHVLRIAKIVITSVVDAIVKPLSPRDLPGPLYSESIKFEIHETLVKGVPCYSFGVSYNTFSSTSPTTDPSGYDPVDLGPSDNPEDIQALLTALPTLIIKICSITKK